MPCVRCCDRERSSIKCFVTNILDSVTCDADYLCNVIMSCVMSEKKDVFKQQITLINVLFSQHNFCVVSLNFLFILFVFKFFLKSYMLKEFILNMWAESRDFSPTNIFSNHHRVHAKQSYEIFITNYMMSSTDMGKKLPKTVVRVKWSEKRMEKEKSFNRFVIIIMNVVGGIKGKFLHFQQIDFWWSPSDAVPLLSSLSARRMMNANKLFDCHQYQFHICVALTFKHINSANKGEGNINAASLDTYFPPTEKRNVPYCL